MVSAFLLFGFALYTIPICTCVEMMKQSENECCAAKAEAKPFDCCQNPTAAEKMNPEKAFESSKTSLEKLEIVSIVFTALNLNEPAPIGNSQSSVYLSPPSCATLQVFRI